MFHSQDHKAPRCSRKCCHLPPPPAPCHWAATSPCDPRVRCPSFPSPALYRPRCSSTRCHRIPLPPAPCHWAATSRCESTVRCPSCRLPSTFYSPDHTAPRCSKNHRRYLVLLRPALCHWAATSPC